MKALDKDVNVRTEVVFTHLDVGCVEVSEGGKSSRQAVCTVTDPQGLEDAGGDTRPLTEALPGEKSASHSPQADTYAWFMMNRVKDAAASLFFTRSNSNVHVHSSESFSSPKDSKYSNLIAIMRQKLDVSKN